ncbi:MAG: hypothetical protein IJK98_05890, partial [Clostridia bacterium]|nr:hypothetical protein [Clostridia bacterium]
RSTQPQLRPKAKPTRSMAYHAVYPGANNDLRTTSNAVVPAKNRGRSKIHRDPLMFLRQCITTQIKPFKAVSYGCQVLS